MTDPIVGLKSAEGAVLFTDLVGFTAFNDARGDAEAVRVLDRQLALASDVIDTCAEGRIVKELGDGLMLWIRSARQAVDGALELLGLVAAEHAAGSFPLQLRVGAHYGEALPRNDDLVGHTVNIAARLADLAGPGELIVSEDALTAAGADAGTFRPVGPTVVRGVSAPIWLYRANRAAG